MSFIILSTEREVLAKSERKSFLRQMQNWTKCWINPDTNPTVDQFATVAQVKIIQIILYSTWLLSTEAI